jgi:hypothetical protein
MKPAEITFHRIIAVDELLMGKHYVYELHELVKLFKSD